MPVRMGATHAGHTMEKDLEASSQGSHHGLLKKSLVALRAVMTNSHIHLEDVPMRNTATLLGETLPCLA